MSNSHTVPLVRDAMVTAPTLVDPFTTMADAAVEFENPKVHMLLLVRESVLLGTVVRADLAQGIAERTPLIWIGRLTGRTTRPYLPLAEVHAEMIEGRQRRLAVVDDQCRLLGLLCLKQSLSGFCSDAGIRARALERHATGMKRVD